jgi:hypothetical protein
VELSLSFRAEQKQPEGWKEEHGSSEMNAAVSLKDRCGIAQGWLSFAWCIAHCHFDGRTLKFPCRQQSAHCFRGIRHQVLDFCTIF